MPPVLVRVGPRSGLCAHRPRREVPLDAGHQVPVGHHLTQMLGPVIVQHPPRPIPTTHQAPGPVWTAGRVFGQPLKSCFGLLVLFFCALSFVLPVALVLCPVPRGGAGSFLIVCTGLDLGGSILDGLASCGGGPSDRPSRSLRVVLADFCPGARSAHPGPFHLEGG